MTLPVTEAPFRRILIADDIADSRQLLASLLRRMTRAAIEIVKDGEHAVAVYRRMQPHITFLDIGMPGKNGLEALKEIRAVNDKAFVVMVSGQSLAATIKEAVDSGADGFIVKPYNARRVHEALQRYVARNDDHDFPLY